MPPKEEREFTIETECEDPKIILEKAKEMAGIRAKIDFTIERVGDNLFKIVCQSDFPFDFNRIIKSAGRVRLIQPKN